VGRFDRRRGYLVMICALSLGLVAAPSLTANAAPVRAPLFSPGAPGAGDPYFPDMGNGGYDVRHYDIRLAFDPRTKAISATTTILARATQNLSRFNLDFQGPLKISKLSVNGRDAAFARSQYLDTGPVARPNLQLLIGVEARWNIHLQKQPTHGPRRSKLHFEVFGDPGVEPAARRRLRLHRIAL